MSGYYNRCDSSNKSSNIICGSNPGLNFSAQFVVKRVPYNKKIYKIRGDFIGLYISLIKRQPRHSVLYEYNIHVQIGQIFEFESHWSCQCLYGYFYPTHNLRPKIAIMAQKNGNEFTHNVIPIRI